MDKLNVLALNLFTYLNSSENLQYLISQFLISHKSYTILLHKDFLQACDNVRSSRVLITFWGLFDTQNI